MATDKTEITGEGGGPVRVEFELALKKIYGAAAAAGQVVDVQEVQNSQPQIADSQGGAS